MYEVIPSMTVKFTISMEDELLERVEEYIDGDKIVNRSQAISYLIRKALGSPIDTAIILAGGMNSEKRITVEINGVPLIKNTINWLKRNGINKIYVTIPKESEIPNIIKDDEVEFIIEEVPHGTAGAIKDIVSRLSKRIVVLNGDNMYSFNLRKMIDKHVKSSYSATLAVYDVEDPHRFGQIIIEGDRIIEFKEKPKENKSHIISAGVYILNPELFKEIKDKTYFEYDYFPKWAKENRLGTYIVPREV